MECEACAIVEREPKIYQDDKVVAVLSRTPAGIGHVLIIPRKHHTILEQVPDFEMGHFGVVINKVSVALFESLKIKGTNVIIQNGVSAGQRVAHVVAHIIPRLDNDGLPLLWKPKTASEEELGIAEMRLKEQTKNIGGFEKEKKPPVNLDKPTEAIKLGKEENYLLKQLERLP